MARWKNYKAIGPRRRFAPVDVKQVATWGLTEKQRQCLSIICEFHAENGHMPTMKWLQHRLGLKTRSATWDKVASLARHGNLKWLPRGTLPVVILTTAVREKAA